MSAFVHPRLLRDPPEAAARKIRHDGASPISLRGSPRESRRLPYLRWIKSGLARAKARPRQPLGIPGGSFQRRGLVASSRRHAAAAHSPGYAIVDNTRDCRRRQLLRNRNCRGAYTLLSRSTCAAAHDRARDRGPRKEVLGDWRPPPSSWTATKWRILAISSLRPTIPQQLATITQRGAVQPRHASASNSSARPSRSSTAMALDTVRWT